MRSYKNPDDRYSGTTAAVCSSVYIRNSIVRRASAIPLPSNETLQTYQVSNQAHTLQCSLEILCDYISQSFSSLA